MEKPITRVPNVAQNIAGQPDTPAIRVNDVQKTRL